MNPKLQMIRVECGEDTIDVHLVAAPTDWAILASDTVLEVRALTGEVTYYPLVQVTRWTVTEVKG